MLDRLPGRERRLRALRRKGDAAMAAHDWTAAADWYGKVLAIRSIATIAVQRGHALREAGRGEEAERAYGSVPDDAPEATDARFYRAITLTSLARQDEAIGLLVAILQADSGHRGAFAELVRLGARDRLPEDFQSRVVPGALQALHREIGQLQTEIANLAAVSTYPLAAYDAFRRAYPIAPPPPAPITRPITVLVDARGVGAAFLRSTLLSLLDQSRQDWSARVLASDVLASHPVASLGHVDPRIAFLTDPDLDVPGGLLLHLSAGTVLDPQALAWFGFAAARAKAPALWCDFDHAEEDGTGGLIHSDPRLWGVHDRDVIAQTASPPAVVLLDGDRMTVPSLGTARPAEWRRTALLRAPHAAQVARLLASVLRLSERASRAPADGEITIWSTDPDGAPPPPGPTLDPTLEIVGRGARPAVSVTRPVRGGERLTVVIPTRDEPDMLRKAVDTLLDTAASRAQIDLTIVDNRSTDTNVLAYLDQLARSGMARIVPLDEPFNWSRANNIAVRGVSTDHLVFANNDIEMLTPGWDELLLGYLQRRDAGVVGARLLYPDGSIQHGGVLLGTGEGPIHEGVRQPGRDAGPLDRLDQTRAVAAVTGAFLATPRAVFEAVGGFDEQRLAIAFNDIDFCLSVRASGRTILYAPAIELVHHESKSRGYNIGRSRVAWDRGEWATLRQRWPSDWGRDPGYNPYWSRHRPFDGLREPPVSQIIDALMRGARSDPWTIAATDACD